MSWYRKNLNRVGRSIARLGVALMGSLLLLSLISTPVFARSGCDRAYPQTVSGRKICIPPPPPDLDCPDLPQFGIREPIAVLSPDPHRFDRDGDGIGCETLR